MNNVVNNQYFKDTLLLDSMATRYIIREIKINKRFARTQVIPWVDQKKIILDIMKDLSNNNLYRKRDEEHPNFNLVRFDDSSLSIISDSDVGKMIYLNLLNADENRTGGQVNDSNYNGNSFICKFRMGLIRHTDILLWREGEEENLFKYFKGDLAGRLSKTAFGIIVSDRLQKILFIKQSGKETVGYNEFLFYARKKSSVYATNALNNTFRLIPMVIGNNFDIEDIASLFRMEIGINSDLINEYRTRTGQNDAFTNIVLSKIQRILGTGRNVSVGINFSEEGDEDAKNLLAEIYSSFIAIQGEEIEKLFTNFKIQYENVSGQSVTVNFKVDKIYTYETDSEASDFDHLFNAFLWLSHELSKPQSNGVVNDQ